MTNDTDFPVLKAILFADLAQYSRLTVAGEAAAFELVTRCFEIFREFCGPYRGEFIKSTGDGVLVIFDSASDALDYALGIQEKFSTLTGSNPAAGQFRIGLHMGEIRRQGGDVYGHAVNLSARVQTLAIPGGVCATQEVYQSLRGTLRFSFRFAGRHVLKNMPDMVAIYHVARLLDSHAVAPPRYTVMVIDGLALLDATGEQIALKSKAAQALIGYLSLTQGLREFRDKMATLLWPERTPAEAQTALANCLRSAERVLAAGEAGGGLRHGGHVSLDPARISVDVQRILSELNEGKIDDLLIQRPDWPEAILYGFDAVSSLYGAWLKITRHNRRERALEGLEHLLGLFDHREVIVKRAATAILALEPSHEAAARMLMRHCVANHNKAAALRVYSALRKVLKESYGLDPTGETMDLAAKLAETDPPLELKSGSEGRVPVIAIGRFTTPDERSEIRGQGFRSELITNLSRFREITIIDLPQDAPPSGFDYLLTADCHEVESQLRLSATLMESVRRRVVWSETFQLSLDTWSLVQRQFVGRIASNVEIYLSQDRLARALQRLPEDLGVYDLWLRGENLLLRWSAEAEDEAEGLFERAIAGDPSFAPAYASLASVYNSRQFIRPGLVLPVETASRAMDLAKRAVDLDPLDARNLMAVAYATAMTKRFEQSEMHFELAAQLNPNDPKVVVSAALGLSYMGQIGPARLLLEHALALASVLPAYLWSHIATIRFLTGDYVGAVEAAERSHNVIADTPGWKAAALGKLGRTTERAAALQELEHAVGKVWAGPAAASGADIRSWFINVFPIRDDAVRSEITAALSS